MLQSLLMRFSPPILAIKLLLVSEVGAIARRGPVLRVVTHVLTIPFLSAASGVQLGTPARGLQQPAAVTNVSFTRATLPSFNPRR